MIFTKLKSINNIESFRSTTATFIAFASVV